MIHVTKFDSETVRIAAKKIAKAVDEITDEGAIILKQNYETRMASNKMLQQKIKSWITFTSNIP